MEAIKFSDKALSVFPMAFSFSAVKSFEERIGVTECELVADLQMMGLTELCGGVGSADNRRLLSRTEQIEQLMGKRVAA